MKVALIGAGLQARRRAPVVFNSSEDEIGTISSSSPWERSTGGLFTGAIHSG